MALTSQPDPNRLIAESSSWALVLNEDQGLLGRCFLLLKRDETDVAALTDAELSELWEMVRRAKSLLQRRFQPDHFNYAFLMNLDPQVHFHVIPRYRLPREFAEAVFEDPAFGSHYPIAPARALDPAVYDNLAAQLRSE